jgi:hypothetical protein
MRSKLLITGSKWPTFGVGVAAFTAIAGVGPGQSLSDRGCR